MNTLIEQTIRGKNLRFDSTDRWVLGPRLVLEQCHIILDRCTWRTLQLQDLRFVDCTIEVRGGLKNFTDWCKCQLIGCRLTGTLDGNSFGDWPDEHGGGGGISDCDFSQSNLTGCQFLGVAMDSLTLPTWPNFTILDPVGREQELTGTKWPGKLDFWIEGVVLCPEPTTALSCNAVDVVKGFDCDVEVLRRKLQYLRGVLM